MNLYINSLKNQFILKLFFFNLVYMKIIVKELTDTNHVYLFDYTMRPLFINIIPKNRTRAHIRKLIKTYDIVGLQFVSEINFD